MIELARAPIGDLVQPVRKADPRKTRACPFHYIDLGSVDQSSKRVIGSQLIDPSDAPSRARQEVLAGDVLVSTVRPNLNGVAVVPEGLTDPVGSTGFSVLRVDPKLLDAQYLFHWVQTNAFIADMVRKSTGQSYPAVSDRVVRDSLIPLPPLDEQKRIAAILDKADALRQARRRAITRLDDLAQSIFYEMFGDPVLQGIERTTLGDLIKVSSGTGLTSKDQRGGSIPVYGGNGITGWHDEWMLERQAIVLGRVGVYCGAVHVTEERSWVTDNALVVTIKDGRLRIPYLAAALKNANLNQYAGRSSQPLISGARIYPVEIPVPEAKAQREYEERVQRVAMLRVKCVQASAKFENLFASLQQRAFRGEL